MDLPQLSFTAGEIGPQLYNRVDNQLYQTGAKTIFNFVVQQFGGVENRTGTRHVAPCYYPDPARAVRLHEFKYNDEQKYILCFGGNYITFVYNGGIVVENIKNISGITLDMPGQVTSISHGFIENQRIYISGLSSLPLINNRWFIAKNVTADTFELYTMFEQPFDTRSMGSYTTGGTAANMLAVNSPWSDDDLFELQFVQDNDVLTITHNDYPPRDLNRVTQTSWSLSTFANTEGPFQDINPDTTKKVYASAASGNVTITATAAIFDSSMVGELFYIEQLPDDDTPRWEAVKNIAEAAVNPFGIVRRAGPHYYSCEYNGTNSGGIATGTYKPDWTEGTSTDGDGEDNADFGVVGVPWKYLHSGFGIVRITGVTSTTVVTAEVIRRLPDNVVGSSNSTYNWAKAAWSVDQGYPKAAIYKDDRLIFGGTKKKPNGIWASGTELRTYFGRSNPILDDERINLYLKGDTLLDIKSFVPMSNLIALTSSSALMIRGNDGPLLATETPVRKPQGRYGASDIPPLIIGETAFFVTATGRGVRTLSNSESIDADTFVGIDVTVRAPHLFKNKRIVQWTYQELPYSVIWVLLDDGTLLGFTYLKDAEVYAWHRHQTNGFIRSIQITREDGYDVLYMVVNRTIDGQPTLNIERTVPRNFDEVRDSYFVDGGLTYDGRNTSLTTVSITGGTSWDENDELSMHSSTPIFSSEDIGASINFTYEGEVYRCEIVSFTDASNVRVIPNISIPTARRNTAFTSWEFARKTFKGAWAVNNSSGNTVLADGNVHEPVTITDGVFELEYPAAVVHIGFGYPCYLQTLSIAYAGTSMLGRVKLVPSVKVMFLETRGAKITSNFFGSRDFDNPLDDEELESLDARDESQGDDDPLALTSGVVEFNVNSNWDVNGIVWIQQTDPLPVTVQAIIPKMEAGSD